jgi:4-carboxymuconolactone decarboxylase
MPENPLADFAPVLVGYTNDVLFGQVWERPELSPRHRSPVTRSVFANG